MKHLGSAGFGLLAGLALNLIYRRIQSEWPESYFSLSDHWSQVKAQVPSRYVLFRFGPVVLLGAFFSRQLAELSWPAWPFVVTAASVHASLTSLRAVWRLVFYRGAGERSAPLIVLHLTTVVAVAACLIGTARLREHLSSWVPDFETIRDAIWAGLIASLLAFAFIRWTRASESNIADVVMAQRQRVGPELIWYARQLARERNLDPDLVETTILTESIQRPRWFRRLERLKGIVFRGGTYGIMQVRSSRPIGDRRSIDRALEMHAVAFELSADGTTESTLVRERLRSYNGSRVFLDLAEEVHGEVAGHW